MVHGLLSALTHLHGMHIMHRDVKPPNILIDAAGSPKLGDFGLYMMMVNGELIGSCTTAVFCGTSGYMAPELIGGIGCGRSSDIWAACITCYEMVTSRVPIMDDQILMDPASRHPLRTNNKTCGMFWGPMDPRTCQSAFPLVKQNTY